MRLPYRISFKFLKGYTEYRDTSIYFLMPNRLFMERLDEKEEFREYFFYRTMFKIKKFSPF